MEPTRTDSRALDHGSSIALYLVGLYAAASSAVHMVGLAGDAGGLDPVTVYAWPVGVDGMTIAAALSLVRSARRRERGSIVARIALGCGLALSLWGNVAAADTITGRVITGSSSVAFALTLEIVLRRRVLEAEPVEITLGRGALVRAEARILLDELAELLREVNTELGPEVNTEPGAEVNTRPVRRVNTRPRIAAAAANTRPRATERVNGAGDARARISAAFTAHPTGTPPVRATAREVGCSPAYVSGVLAELRAATAAATVNTPDPTGRTE